MIFWIWAAAIVVVLGLYLRQVYSRFSAYGVKHFKPVPLLGNFSRLVFRLDNFTDDIERTYNAFPGERFVGRYDLTVPMIVVRDLELIKKITVKDFESFLDHRELVKKENDQLFGRILFSLKGDEWKDMRSTLSPAFTSSKIRLMVPFMTEIGDRMIKTLKDRIRSSGVNFIDIDAKDLTTRYTNDVIASCAFGIKVDSQTDPQNEFYMTARKASEFGGLGTLLRFFGMLIFPKLMDIFKVSTFPPDVRDFFRGLVMKMMREREENNIVRPDMIHLLMQAKKGKLTHDDKVADSSAGFATVEESAVGKKKVTRVWTDDDLVAQAVIFIIAGLETVSTAMSFLLHELAVNPDVQEKLVQEIRENDAKHDGKFDYNSVQQLKYLDMVISEILRLWPPAVSIDRLCKKDYNLGKPNNKTCQHYIVRKGECIFVPVWAIHRDPNYFPNPSKFDPERFSEQNKHNIKPFTYMPFGLGPRNCIGSRFALCELKVIVYQLVQSMEVTRSPKTQVPAKLSKRFGLRIEGGHSVRLKIRNCKLFHDDKTAADADAGFATVEEHAVGKTAVSRAWTDNDLVAQAVLFLMAGFETVSSAMSFLIHELAVNPDVQEKLVQEIREYEARNGGKFDYNSIQQMSYMDMVISEVLRLWPPAVNLDRICIRDYNLGKANDKAEDFIVRAGEGIVIPVWAIHRDPNYFPNPSKFDPERFSEQNKHNIKPFTYMPFGLGPRNCIGSRFALCEVKVMAYQLLRSVELSPSPRTQIPAKLSKDSFNLRIDGGHWASLKLRN